MSYLAICILLLASELAFSEKFCLSENPCECVLPNKTIINLYSVGLLEYPRFQDVRLNPNCSELYSYNPCFPFDSSEHTVPGAGHKSCSGASACVKSFGGSDGTPPEEYAIGFQNTATFGQSNDKIYISYNVSQSKTMLKVNLNCINESSDIHYLTMDELNCSDSLDLIVFTLTSPCACPNGCLKNPPIESSPGLSTGSKLLIAFFTILLAYLIIGIVWNYCNGSQGMELIPNIEFWNNLPTLIMEGIVFTCSCCGRQSSYGEV